MRTWKSGSGLRLRCGRGCPARGPEGGPQRGGGRVTAERSAAGARRRGARGGGGQREHGGGARQAGAPPGELGFEAGAGEPAPLPERVVGVLDGQRGQRRLDRRLGRSTPAAALPALLEVLVE